MSELKRCNKCVVSNQYPGLQFDEDGICEFCRAEERQEKKSWDVEKRALEDRIEAIKKEAHSYQAIVPWSGGKDSTYALYIMKVVYGLKVLAVNFDNGFKSEKAHQNIKNISTRLGVDVVNLSPEQKLMNDLYRHYLQQKGELCSVCNMVGYILICSFIFSQKAIHGYLPLIVGGWANTYENVRSLFTFDFPEFKRIVSKDPQLYQRLETSPLVNRKVLSLLASMGDPRTAFNQLGGDLGHKFLQLPDYIKWDLGEIKEVLKGRLGWESSDSLTAAHEDCQWHDCMKYLMVKKYGIDHDTIAVAAMVRSKQISRQEGLKALREISLDQEPTTLEPLLKKIDCTLDDIKWDADWYTGKNERKKDDLYRKSFQRNIGILTEDDQEKIRNTCIAIAGSGGVGGIYMATLARLGVGRFVISDPDIFDYPNLNRQYGATIETIGQNKAEVMKKIVASINPEAEIKVVEGGLTEDNIEHFIDGCDLVLDCLDAYNISECRKLHQIARQKNLYSLKAAPMGFGASLMVFSPNGMSFNEYFQISEDEDLKIENLLNNQDRLRKLYQNMMDGFSPSRLFESYLDPSAYSPFMETGEFSQKPMPSLCPSVYLCSDLVTTEALFIILKKREPITVPQCLEIDLYRKIFKISHGQERADESY